MLNLVLYSDQIIPANDKVDKRLLGLMDGRNGRIGYVPSGAEPDLRYYGDRQLYYSRLALQMDVFFDLDGDVSTSAKTRLFDCDAIHLSGGDTKEFLRRLKRSGMLDELRAWAQGGGVLVGASAGSIIMTPTIAVDGLFLGQKADDLKDESALGLVPFEFFPHLEAEPSYASKLLSYSARNCRPIIACPDGDGVVVSRGIIECIGDAVWYVGGAVQRRPKLALSELAQ